MAKQKIISSSEFYQVPQILLRFMCTTSEKDQNHVNLLRFGVLFWCDFIPLISVACLQIVFCIHLYRTGFDLQEFCYAQSCIAYQSTAFSKTIAIALKSSKLNEIFVQLNAIHPASVNEQNEYKITEWLMQTKSFMKRYACIQIFMIASYIVIPMYSYFKMFIETGVWQMELPLKFWLPFETTTAINFYSVYMVHSWIGFSAGICLSSTDLMLLAIIHLVCIHFDHIYRNLNDLKPDDFNEFNIVKSCVLKQTQIIR